MGGAVLPANASINIVDTPDHLIQVSPRYLSAAPFQRQSAPTATQKRNRALASPVIPIRPARRLCGADSECTPSAIPPMQASERFLDRQIFWRHRFINRPLPP